jgi:hypothetical protein
MKKIFIVLFTILPLFVIGQDKIVKNTGEILEVKIIEIGIEKISYKKFSNQNGPLYSIEKSNVLKVNLENGDVEDFTNETHTATQKNTFQNEPNNSLLFTFGMTFPHSNFGQTEIEHIYDWGLWPNSNGDAIVASKGIIFGVKKIFPLMINGFGLYGSFDLSINWIISETINQYFEGPTYPQTIDFTEFGWEGVDASYKYKLPIIYNVPIVGGVNYTHNLGNRLSIWLDFGVGVNTRIISKLSEERRATFEVDESLNSEMYAEFNGKEYIYIENIKYKMATSFVYQVSLGINISKKMIIGFHYYGIGATNLNGVSSYKYTQVPAWYMQSFEYNIIESERFTFKNTKFPSNMFTIKVGYIF